MLGVLAMLDILAVFGVRAMQLGSIQDAVLLLSRDYLNSGQCRLGKNVFCKSTNLAWQGSTSQVQMQSGNSRTYCLSLNVVYSLPKP